MGGQLGHSPQLHSWVSMKHIEVFIIFCPLCAPLTQIYSLLPQRRLVGHHCGKIEKVSGLFCHTLFD